MLTLQIVTVSTRQGRLGPAVAAWFTEIARAHGGFAIEPLDLAEIGLPLFDEPNHPRLRQYQHEHTKRWSEIVERSDAYAFVTPEYNYSAPPSLVNALDYLYHEWHYKPVAFVSYGGGSGGLRSVQMAKQIVTALRMMPIPEGVSIPFFAQAIDKQTGRFNGTEQQAKAAAGLLDELHKWAQGLKSLRG